MELKKVGAKVSYYDSHIPSYKLYGTAGKSVPALTPNVLKSADLVVIACAHSDVDYRMVQKNAKMVFDLKNVMKDVRPRGNIRVL